MGAVGSTEMLKVAVTGVPGTTLPKVKVAELMVILLPVEARVARVLAAVLLPALVVVMIISAVSPGSRRPLLFPFGSDIVIAPTCKTGA